VPCKLYRGDCLDILPTIASGCVDLILCDLPYGTTACKWDSVIPIEPLFAEYRRIAKPNAAIVLTAQQPFATDLINGWRKGFRYELIWEKNCALGFFNANKMPLRAHENILVFYAKLPTYNPQKTFGHKNYGADGPYKLEIYGTARTRKKCGDGSRYPRSVLKFNKICFASSHPTQKPIDLFRMVDSNIFKSGRARAG
jgi:site-specific DNA-methyltransferase (adenine-specific)